MNHCTRAGIALWDQLLEARRRGGLGPAERVEAEWAKLPVEEQVAATRAGTALWREVVGRNSGAEP
jgi:hypothetical protein